MCIYIKCHHEPKRQNIPLFFLCDFEGWFFTLLSLSIDIKHWLNTTNVCSEAFSKFLFMVGKEPIAAAYCELAMKNF